MTLRFLSAAVVCAAAVPSLLQRGSRRASAPAPATLNPAGPDGLPPQVQKVILHRIALEQEHIFQLLSEAGRDLNSTQKRINFDLMAAQKSVASLMDLQNRTLESNTTALKNARNSQILTQNFPIVAANADATMNQLKTLNDTINATKASMGDVVKIISAGKRVEDGQGALDLIKPRLKTMEKRMSAMESRMYMGNLTALVNDAVDEHIVNTIEDVGRGFAANLPMPGVVSPVAPGPAPAHALVTKSVRQGHTDVDADDEETEESDDEDDGDDDDADEQA